MLPAMSCWRVAAASSGRRLFSSSAVVRASMCKALVYDKLGQPEDVVKYVCMGMRENYPEVSVQIF